ncbi:MAG: alpha/beta hydrolase [Deltaproteobacteria bacterium]|nr:alpha/beta hydrolase [Deltaproteobacteria bacterium]
MDRLYLIGSVIGLLLTGNAWWPLRRPAVLGALSFFAGWLTAELPLHHIAFQAALTWWFHGQGAFETPVGEVGLALAGVSWVGLALLLRPAAETRRLIVEAVDEAFEHPGERLVPRRDLGRLAMPFRFGDRAVSRTRDIVYAEGGGPRMRLDVYRPRGDAAGALRPVLLHIHGGGWVIGSKDTQGLPLMRAMAARGWVAVNANYRLSPRATFPDHLIDVKRATAWVRSHIERYGGDPSSIVIAGLSAGAHLASLAALTPNRPELQPGFETADTRLDGCVAMYGVYDVLDRDRDWPHRAMTRLMAKLVIKARPDQAPALWKLASPLDQVGPHAPPFLIVHGDRDTMVPVGQARRFRDALRRAAPEVPVAYAELPGAQHAFDVFYSLRTNLALDGVAAFLERVRVRRRTVGSGEELGGT